MDTRTSRELREQEAIQTALAEAIGRKAEKEGRALTDDEITESNDYLAAADKFDKEAQHLAKAEEQMLKIKKRAESMRQPEPQVTTPNEPETAVATMAAPVSRVPARCRSLGRLRGFKGPDAEFNAYSSGMWLLATFFDNKKADRWCELNGLYRQLAQEEGTATAGGNLVPAPLEASIIDNRDRFGVFRPNVRIYPMTADTHDIPKVSGSTSAAFVGESGTIGESDKAWIQVSLTAKKVGRINRVSSELAEDAIINIMDDIAVDFARAFAEFEDTLGFTGDGTATHGSIDGLVKKFEDTPTLAGYVQAALDEFSELVIGDITGFMAVCPQYALANAKFYMSSYAFHNGVLRLAAAGGGNTIATLVDGMTRQSWLGFPIVISEKLPGSGDLSDNVMMLFGDLTRSSVLGDRRSIRFDVSDAPYFTADQLALRALERIDIVNHDVGDVTDAGPVVALVGAT